MENRGFGLTKKSMMHPYRMGLRPKKRIEGAEIN